MALLASAMVIFLLCTNVDTGARGSCSAASPAREHEAILHITCDIERISMDGHTVPTNQMCWDTKRHFMKNIFIYSNITNTHISQGGQRFDWGGGQMNAQCGL